MKKEKHYLYIANLISKEINRSISEEESKTLNKWLEKSHENKAVYNKIKKNYWFTNSSNEEGAYDLEEGWEAVKPKIQSSRFGPMVPSVLKYAAILLVLLGLGYLLNVNLLNSKGLVSPKTVINQVLEPGTDKATLTLDDGSVVALEKGVSYSTHYSNSNGKEIVYKASKVKKHEVKYNYLTIPRGGQFYMELSDGTKVWLNSESKLKYPVAFIEGEDRLVELVYGEAYFDVTPSSQAGGVKFRVLNESQEIEVVGTEFNVKAYKEDASIATTLVEGKVAVGNSSSSRILIPGNQSVLNLTSKSFAVSAVNVYDQISWKEGVFSFKNHSLEEITKVLSRWYSVDFVFENESVKELQFNGVFRKSKTLEEILQIIGHTNEVKYNINQKTIYMK